MVAQNHFVALLNISKVEVAARKRDGLTTMTTVSVYVCGNSNIHRHCKVRGYGMILIIKSIQFISDRVQVCNINSALFKATL